MYRIRIHGAHGTAVEGGFATYEDVLTRQAALNAVYASMPADEWCLTCIEAYTPTRPVLERTRVLLAQAQALAGETDPILRCVQGLPPATPALALYEGLREAWTALAARVYEEEGRYESTAGPPPPPPLGAQGKEAHGTRRTAQ